MNLAAGRCQNRTTSTRKGRWKRSLCTALTTAVICVRDLTCLFDIAGCFGGGCLTHFFFVLFFVLPAARASIVPPNVRSGEPSLLQQAYMSTSRHQRIVVKYVSYASEI